MTEREQQARKQADDLHKAIYEALRDGYNVTVYVSSPLPKCNGQAFWRDKRTTRLNGVEQRHA
jgi:hypothetical protein